MTKTITAKNENFRLCLLLAFQSVVTNGRTKTQDAEKKVVELAKRMDEFCALHDRSSLAANTMSFVDDAEAAKLDDAISKHLTELKSKEQTNLPQDRETLIRLYDRLQQRKSRRLQAHFYMTAKEEKLSDLVLRYLDEEIEDEELAQ